MNPLAPPFRSLAQTPPGLEPLLLGELRALGIHGTALQGGVRWSGGWEDLFRTNLELRTASRVLVEVGAFRVRALGELERKAESIPWGGLPPGPLRFRISASRSRLYHEGAIEERLRRAAARVDPQRPIEGAGAGGEGPLLVVRVHRDELTLRLDSSGAHLHQRGYRVDVGEAPMRETLAAALLLSVVGTDPADDLPMGSPPASLLDPFCGSGTLPIEAALWSRQIPPGLASPDRSPRAYAFTDWGGAPLDLWAGVCANARARILEPSGRGIRILGSDRDGRVVEAARRNAARAGVSDEIEWAEATLSRCPVPPEPGWVVTNPPWGGRLGDRKRLRALYGALGQALAPGGRFDGWGIALSSGDPVLANALAQGAGQSALEVFRTTSGGLPIQGIHIPGPRTSGALREPDGPG
jgi:putative N6-adenine-specific DNA methylase